MPQLADPARIAVLKEPGKVIALEDAAVKTAFPNAGELVIVSNLNGAAPAASVSGRLFALASAPHGRYSLVIVGDAFAAQPGDTISLEAAELWGGERAFFVTGADNDTGADTTILRIYGGAS